MVRLRGVGRRALRVGLFALGLALLLTLLSWLYRPRDNGQQSGILAPTAYGWLSEPVGSIDVFFVGSSEFYSDISPLRLWNEAGITSYDYAISDARIYQLDQNVGRVLHSRRPKLIVVDAYVLLRGLEPDEAVFNQFQRWFPILDYHENWKRLRPDQLLSPVRYTVHQMKKGFRPGGHTVKARNRGYMRDTDRRYPLDQQSWYYLRHIRRACERAGVPLLILASPSPRNWGRDKSNTLLDYGACTGVDVLDLNLLTQEIGIDLSTDYKDNGDHLNGHGAYKVSVWLAQYLRTHYDLTDHRGDPAYLQWQEDYDTYSGT